MKIIEQAKLIEKVADDKKGENIKVLDLKGVTEIADYFVIVTANNVPHIKSICDEIERALYSKGLKFLRKEGYDEGNWIILDYGDVVVHLMLAEQREYYGLEKFWREAKEADF
ncbi:ribosome silencing factor [Proteinivorax hydrogeniformans]|uniref:Ribosomal silencing factor RsfS n=1 Tax=Proteinivorax hydrogeniformans TaxID=1826727 RepID=A0AAU8HWQ0_9FIRM